MSDRERCPREHKHGGEVDRALGRCWVCGASPQGTPEEGEGAG
jgi:hypothetical protein